MTGLTTDPKDPSLGVIEPSGMQQKYLVLSEEERAKGFTRPVYRKYRHKKCGQVTTMGEALCETYAVNPSFYGGTMCVSCGTHFQLREYTEEPLDEADKAAGRVLHKAYTFEWLDDHDRPAGLGVGE